MATNGHTPDFRECDEFFDLRTVEHEASHVVPYIKPNSRIIDVGCGIGAITLDFARRVPEGYVLGVDYSAGECRSRPYYKRKSKKKIKKRKSKKKIRIKNTHLFHLTYSTLGSD